MKRLSLMLAATAGLLGTSGCTHCDTCATFPIPCVGGNCGGSDSYVTAPASGYTGNGMVMGQVSSTVPMAAQVASASPFAAQTQLTPAPSIVSQPSTVPSSVLATAPRTDVKVPATIPMPAPRSRADDSASSPPTPLGPEGAPGAGS